MDCSQHFSIPCMTHCVQRGIVFYQHYSKSVGKALCFGHFILALMSPPLFNTKWRPCCCCQPIHQSDGSASPAAGAERRRSSLGSPLPWVKSHMGRWCPEGRPHGETCGGSTLPQWSHERWRPGEPAGPSHKRERGHHFSLGHKKCTSKNRLHSLIEK